MSGVRPRADSRFQTYKNWTNAPVAPLPYVVHLRTNKNGEVEEKKKRERRARSVYVYGRGRGGGGGGVADI